MAYFTFGISDGKKRTVCQTSQENTDAPQAIVPEQSLSCHKKRWHVCLEQPGNCGERGGGVVLVFSTYLQIHLLQVYSRFNEELDEFLDKAIAFFDPDGRGFPCVDQKQTEVYNMQRRKVLCPDYYKTLYQMANEADSWHDPTGTMSLMERSYRALPPGTTLPASLKYRCKDFY